MILVTGANGVVGEPLCKKLSMPFIKVSRVESNRNCIQWDMQQPLSTQNKKKLTGVTELIHCAPIWLLPDHIEILSELGVRRLVVFSSTSVIVKQNTQDSQERQLVAKLQRAEESLQLKCQQTGLSLTLLRPSMIYGYGKDQNVSHIANIIRRYRCMLVVGEGKGLRQPVHADDLVDVVIAVLGNSKTDNKQYNLAGAEVISYKEMLRRIFIGLDRKPIIVPLPLWLFRSILNLASKVSSFSYSPDMADRMNQNLIYDNQAAVNDFNYQPQGFLENPQRDLVC